MEILFILSAICLVLFMILATYDGAYLHIWKYELFNQKDSIFEHKTHTIRAILFPLIVWLIFVNNDYYSFVIGVFLVLIDLIVLAIDAYSEKDSRSFMGGLPKWEYIIHLFVNAFHFSTIVLIIATRLTLVDDVLSYVPYLSDSIGKQIFSFVAINTVPGAIILALVHLLLITDYGKNIWNINRLKIRCC